MSMVMGSGLAVLEIQRTPETITTTTGPVLTGMNSLGVTHRPPGLPEGPPMEEETLPCVTRLIGAPGLPAAKHVTWAHSHAADPILTLQGQPSATVM